MGLLLDPKTSILGIFGGHFGGLGAHFGDPGRPLDPGVDVWGSEVVFLTILSGFGVPMGDRFGLILCTFSVFSVSKWEVGLRTAF